MPPAAFRLGAAARLPPANRTAPFSQRPRVFPGRLKNRASRAIETKAIANTADLPKSAGEKSKSPPLAEVCEARLLFNDVSAGTRGIATQAGLQTA